MALRDRIGKVLRAQEDFDITGYRPTYVARRVSSRLAATGESPETYGGRLEEDAAERKALVEALGINVTSFFRDAAVWQFLEEVSLPPLVDEVSSAGRVFRALSLGCAGGQEAYSIAMLLSELLDGRLEAFHVDAWDMDEAALEVAKEAWYPNAALATVSSAARQRYFVAEGAGYRVSPAVRARVSVERHDMLTKDLVGEFDLVLLRNVIIYFDAGAKERLLRRVHARISPGGLLVLGQAETIVGAAVDAFRPLSLRNRVYAKVPV